MELHLNVERALAAAVLAGQLDEADVASWDYSVRQLTRRNEYRSIVMGIADAVHPPLGFSRQQHTQSLTSNYSYEISRAEPDGTCLLRLIDDLRDPPSVQQFRFPFAPNVGEWTEFAEHIGPLTLLTFAKERTMSRRRQWTSTVVLHGVINKPIGS